MSSKHVLITGGLGFIGVNLAKELAGHAWDVRLFDNLSPQIHGMLPHIDADILSSPQVEVVRGDVRDGDALKTALRGVDSIVHLAAETGTAQSMYQIAHYNHVNSQATASLMDLLANEPHSVKKLVLASSRSVYGEGAYRCQEHGLVFPDARSVADLQSHRWDLRCSVCSKLVRPVPTPESAVQNPASIYAATKLAQEHLVRIAGGALNIPTVVLRLQNVFGAGQSLNNPYTGILSIFSTRIRRGMTLPIFEDGLESRDFVHVEDVCWAFRLALESDSPDGKVLNVGSGKPVSVMQVAELLVDMLGGSVRPAVTGQYRLGDIRHCYADLTQVSDALGYSPKVDINEGLRRFADWVLTQPLPEDGLDRANEELKKNGMMA